MCRSLPATGNPQRPAPRGAGVYAAERTVAAIALRIACPGVVLSSVLTPNCRYASSKPAYLSSRCHSSVFHDGALRAEVDCPVVGRDRGLDDVAVAQIFRVFGLP